MSASVYARATGSSKRDAVGMLSFAKMSSLGHVIAFLENTEQRTGIETAAQSQYGKDVAEVN